MTELFLMKLDEEERNEEIVRYAVENPIKTVSVYNAWRKLRAEQAQGVTLPGVVQTLPKTTKPLKTSKKSINQAKSSKSGIKLSKQAKKS